MSRVRKNIILNPRTEIDLVALFYTIGNRAFSEVCKDALRRLSRCQYEPKNPLPSGMILRNDFDKEKSIRVCISLCSAKDEDIRNLLQHVQERYASKFIKTAIRLYAGSFLLQALLTNDIQLQIHQTIPQQVYSFGGTPVYIQTKKITKDRPVSNKPKKASVIKEESPKNLSNAVIEKTEEQKANDFLDSIVANSQENSQEEDDDMLSMLTAMLS